MIGAEDLDRLGSAWHVGSLRHNGDSVIHKLLCVFAIDFILRSAGQSNITFHTPNSTAARGIYRSGNTLGIQLNSAAFHLFNLLYHRQIDSVFIVNIAVGIRHGNHFCSQLRRFFIGINRYIP